MCILKNDCKPEKQSYVPELKKEKTHNEKGISYPWKAKNAIIEVIDINQNHHNALHESNC
jgi:hypothetical protein